MLDQDNLLQLKIRVDEAIVYLIAVMLLVALGG